MSDLERLAKAGQTPSRPHGVPLVSVQARAGHAFWFGFNACLGAMLASAIVGIVVFIGILLLGALGMAVSHH